MSTLNEYRDLECEANGMTTPEEKAKLRSEVEVLTVRERMAEFWKDYEVGQNPGVIQSSDYTPSRLT